MNLHRSIALTLLAWCAGQSWAADAPLQSRASFEAAVHNGSTAPPYVAITIVDDRSGSSRATCTTVNLLVGAVHIEHDLPSTAAGDAEAQRIILSTTDHVFHFARPEALSNLPMAFSPEDLGHVRERLKGISLAGLRIGFASTGPLHSIYQSLPMPRHAAYRDATACVLIERGLSPGMGDISDQLWIAGPASSPFSGLDDGTALRPDSKL